LIDRADVRRTIESVVAAVKVGSAMEVEGIKTVIVTPTIPTTVIPAIRSLMARDARDGGRAREVGEIGIGIGRRIAFRRWSDVARSGNSVLYFSGWFLESFATAFMIDNS